MFLNSDYVDPAELTGYARAAAADLEVNQFTLSRWLPSLPVDDLVYRFTRGGDGLVDAATFRAYDAESRIGSRPGLTRVTGELPPISRKIRLGEYERLRQRKLEQKVGTAIMTDAERMVRSILARMEVARGQALVTGSVSINEDGVVAVANFGRNAGHTVTAATPWSTTASATPLADLLSWRDTYVANTGSEPGAILTSRTVVGYLLRNSEFRALAATVAGTPSIVSQTAVQAVLDAHGLPPIYTYDAQVRVNGAATRPISADRLLLLPAPTADPGGTDLGATLYGTTAESMEPNYNLSGDEPGIVAGAYTSQDPVSVWTKAAAIGLPVLANPDLSFCADVA